jgi:hypothetical protein
MVYVSAGDEVAVFSRWHNNNCNIRIGLRNTTFKMHKLLYNVKLDFVTAVKI